MRKGLSAHSACTLTCAGRRRIGFENWGLSASEHLTQKDWIRELGLECLRALCHLSYDLLNTRACYKSTSMRDVSDERVVGDKRVGDKRVGDKRVVGDTRVVGDARVIDDTRVVGDTSSSSLRDQEESRFQRSESEGLKAGLRSRMESTAGGGEASEAHHWDGGRWRVRKRESVKILSFSTPRILFLVLESSFCCLRIVVLPSSNRHTHLEVKSAKTKSMRGSIDTEFLQKFRIADTRTFEDLRSTKDYTVDPSVTLPPLNPSSSSLSSPLFELKRRVAVEREEGRKKIDPTEMRRRWSSAEVKERARRGEAEARHWDGGGWRERREGRSVHLEPIGPLDPRLYTPRILVSRRLSCGVTKLVNKHQEFAKVQYIRSQRCGIWTTKTHLNHPEDIPTPGVVTLILRRRRRHLFVMVVEAEIWEDDERHQGGKERDEVSGY
ncbi:hypothetical protein C8R42DRAFT_740893 [Lentinula raphanica]|nr:hypothetical protein C8R42DRAFT_740893 [Lentinula raphanica]